MAKFYEGRKQGYCPKCGTKIVDWNDSVIDGNTVIYYFTCECGLAGSELYNLVYENTSGDDATWEDLEEGWDISLTA